MKKNVQKRNDAAYETQRFSFRVALTKI